MKKYSFKLNKVLEVREIEEEQAQNTLAQEQQKERDIKKEIDRLQEVQNELYQFLRGNQEISFDEKVAYREYIHTNRYNIQRTERDLRTQESIVENVRQDYLEKRKRREILEKLKEKDYKRYYKEYLQKEQKELDELGLRAQGMKGV